MRRWAPGILGTLLALAFFQLLPSTGVVTAGTFPPFSEAAAALLASIATPAFWVALADTLLSWSLALAIAVAIAVPLGIAIGTFKPLDWASRAIIEFLRPIPSVSLIPLTVLVFGIGRTSTLFLAVFGAIWPILVQTIYGVKSVDPVATDTARSFGYSVLGRLWRVTLPSALPFIATGVRISAAIVLVLVITAELIVGSPGLGREIALAQQSASYATMYGLILTTGLLGWAANSGLEALERRVLRWHTSHRGAVDGS